MTLSKETYILDANIFIEAQNRYYGMDFAPGFWAQLAKRAEVRSVVSIDRVKEEVRSDKEPDMNEWIDNDFKIGFLSTNVDSIAGKFAEVMESVQSNTQYSPHNVAEFARGADGWIIASALLGNYTVVTKEKYAPQNSKKVKIPNICEKYGIRCIDTFTMIRELGIAWSN